jgi:hypothetical protein
MDHLVLSDENLIGLTWFGVPDHAGYEDLETVFAQVTRAHARHIGFATRIQTDLSHKADASVRKGVAELLRRYSPRLGAAVVIYEAVGFRAAALRAIITTINILSRAEFHSQVHAHLDAGVDWLVKSLGAEAPPGARRRLLALLPAQPPSHWPSARPEMAGPLAGARPDPTPRVLSK